MNELYNMALQARINSGDSVRLTINQGGYLCTIFESGDELRLYMQETQIECLTQHEVENYTNRVFVDYELPDSACRAIIDKLGLRNYVFYFGFCDKESKNG